MKKYLIPFVIVILLVIIGGYKYYAFKNPDKIESITNSVANSVTPTVPTTSTAIVSGSGTSDNRNANVQVSEPIGGTLYGVVEIGASGFNSFVIEADVQDNYKVISKEFGESLAYEGFITTQDVQSGLKKYLSSIFNKGVSGRNVHFIISSGALKNEKTKLIAKAIKDMGYQVNEVTADQEGKYALKALLPKEYRANSFAVDMGSGNTKISWYEGTQLKTVETYGAKYFQNGKTDGNVYSEISTLVTKVPQELRKNMFIIGGVPFELAKQTGSGSRFILLKNPQDYTADNAKVKSGLNIYKAIKDATNPGNVIWDWDCNFTMGYILSIN
jgi:hypothetical protein